MKLLSIEAEAAACRKALKSSKVGDFAWHVHHQKLAEALIEPAENRIAYILAEKPESEQALRLRLMRPVKSKTVASAEKAYDAAVASARKAYDATVASARKAYDATVAPARKAYDAAFAPAHKAYDATVAPAWKAYDAAFASAHSKECPGCPWDGGTIFP